MNKRIKIFRIISIVLLLFTGINAIIAGLLFILDPSGHTIGMSAAYLSHSPFSNFMLPGITLLVVNGLFNIIAAIYSIKMHPSYPLLILLQGTLLSGWILFQVYWVRDFNGLHMTMLAIGFVLLINGLVLKKTWPTHKLNIAGGTRSAVAHFAYTMLQLQRRSFYSWPSS